MNLSMKYLLAAAVALLGMPVVHATSIDIDDRTESPLLIVNGVSTPEQESFSVSGTVPGIFTGVNVRFIVLDPGTQNVSDIISLQVTAGTDTTTVAIAFQSDEEAPLTYTPDPTLDEIITETGDFQTIYTQTSGDLNLVIRFASDIEAVPEPSSLALLGVAFAVLAWSRHRGVKSSTAS